jgi:hypothetical protein
MMRRVLVDIARRRRGTARRPNAVRVSLDGIDIPANEPGADLLAVDSAIGVGGGRPARRGRGASLLWRSVDSGDGRGAGISVRTVSRTGRWRGVVIELTAANAH